MRGYKVLILTDHLNHSKENSVYSIANSLRKHRLIDQVDISTRGNIKNANFYKNFITSKLWVSRIDIDFKFTDEGSYFNKNLTETDINAYDIVWLRLPPPLSKYFLDFLINIYPKGHIINNPSGIYKAGSKAFLVNFEKVCPPMKVCKNLDDIIAFKNRFPIVLKPFRDYGGRGIVRIDGDKVFDGNREMSFKFFTEKLAQNDINFLAVKFLKNVTKGDKRIIVVDGKIMGASLRIPAEDSWMCNVAMGGSSELSEVTKEEYEIVKTVHPTLSKMGIVMYGIDTLMGDDGKRLLSEINTTSIGGIAQIEKQKDLPLVDEVVDRVLQNFLKERHYENR